MPISEAARTLGARADGDLGRTFTGVCTDTRTGAAGTLFFALRGENADGHRYAAAAAGQGAAAAVVERPVPEAVLPQLVVPDALVALGDLAAAWRRRFSIPVVGVTGSVGKTSTREMVVCALGARMRVLSNERNFNNEIGVPLTLYALDETHRAAVLEMAMRGAGQIARLADIGGPTIGLVTNVGLSHVELLGSREAIADAKGELLDHLPGDGTAVLNADDDFCERLRARCRCRVITFGVANAADVRASDIAFRPDGGSEFRVNGVPVALSAPGVHHVANAAAACAAAIAVGVPLEEAAARLGAYRPPAMRMETVEAPAGVTILNDTYNAAPDSMHAALDTLMLLSGGRRRAVAVLGTMRELGDQAMAAHRYVGELAAAAAPALLVTVGDQASEIARAALPSLGSERVVSLADTAAAIQELPGMVQPGDIVLVKGSRALEMERIVEALAGRPLGDVH